MTAVAAGRRSMRPTVRRSGRGSRRSGWNTVVGVVLTAIMLFPVYWMINVSLTPATQMRKSPPSWFPATPTFVGYRTVLHDQLPFLLHQPADRAGYGRGHPGHLGPGRL